MNVTNLILIAIVIGVAIAIVRRFVTKRQNEEVEDQMQVDDRTYTLETMIAFVKRRLDEITKINLYDIGLSEEELKRRKNKKYELKKLGYLVSEADIWNYLTNTKWKKAKGLTLSDMVDDILKMEIK